MIKNIETFKRIRSLEAFQLIAEAPYVDVCGVNVARYEVTVTEIPEQLGVLQKRLQDLWDIHDNSDDLGKFEMAEKELKYELQGEMGNRL